MKKTLSMPGYKVIRDAVHGDIMIDERFIKIIDTPEFQRLRRIRQLSTAYLLFPSADHTRFSHSIGTYQVMQYLLNHFIPMFDSSNLNIKERDKLLVLGAALLHDIGHGPFSHAFENALPNSERQKKHEEWTVDIITSEKSNINRVLIENFDSKFPEDLAILIKKERDIKKHRKELEYDEIDLFFIMSSLVSSQLDADRMDYLLRDAHFTGVSYGKYDISRLINSLAVTVHENKYYVCVHEKYLSTIEEYLIARYQMHQGVYLHSFKCEMELIVKKILYRVYELYKLGKNKEYIPKPLLSVFNNSDMTVEEYISLDDTTMFSLFTTWRESEDNILSMLCASFLDRKKFSKLDILNNSDDEIHSFKQELIKILGKHEYSIKDLKDEYFWIEDKQKNQTYKDRKDNIWVLRENGTICDLFEISKLVNEKLKDEINMTFINFELLKEIEQLNNEERAVEEIKELINAYHNRSHVEIEKKYCLIEGESFEKIVDILEEYKYYNLEDCGIKQQEDIYYDTNEQILFKNNKTLRIRNRGDKYILTIKTPTKNHELNSSGEDVGQNERFEYEIQVDSGDILRNAEYIIKYLPELKDKVNQLERSLTIINNRKKLQLKNRNVVFEMVFDDVNYIGRQEVHEFQVEIELKSDYVHRINLKMLTDYLETKISSLKPIYESKYKRGLVLTKSINN